MQQQTAKFMEFLQSNDKLRMNELKQIEQEQYYIGQLKEQRERMEVLKMEFLKKDAVIAELQSQNQSLLEDFEQMRSSFQDQMQNQEKEILRYRKHHQEREELLKDLQELKDLVEHLREENENLNSLLSQGLEKQRQQEDQLLQYEVENEQLKAEIAKLDELLFATEPLKEENQKLKDELKTYKGEKKKIQNEMRQSRLEINKQLEEFKQVIQDQSNEILKMQQYKENHHHMKAKLQEYEKHLVAVKQNNDELKLEIKRLYEKEESDIKMKSEIDRVSYQIKQVRQDLLSVRNHEVQKLNELFNGILRNGSLDHSREKFI